MIRDIPAGLLIVAAIGLSVAVAWWLCYVARVEWFRVRLLEGNRTRQIIAMLPIVIPACIVLALIL